MAQDVFSLSCGSLGVRDVGPLCHACHRTPSSRNGASGHTGAVHPCGPVSSEANRTHELDLDRTLSEFRTSFTAVPGPRSHPNLRGGRWAWRSWWSPRSWSRAGPRARARDYGASRRWVITLVQRFLAEGEAGLEPRSRRPRRSPGRVDGTVEDDIVARPQGARRARSRQRRADHHRAPAPPARTRPGRLDDLAGDWPRTAGSGRRGR